MRTVTLLSLNVICYSILPAGVVMIGSLLALVTALAHFPSRKDTWTNKLILCDFCFDAVAGLGVTPFFLSVAAKYIWINRSEPIWVSYVSLFIGNSLLNVGPYLQIAEVVASSVSVFGFKSLSKLIAKVPISSVVILSLTTAMAFQVVDCLLGNKVVKEGNRYHMRSTEFYFTDEFSMITTVHTMYNIYR